jgi:hypothetical protein
MPSTNNSGEFHSDSRDIENATVGANFLVICENLRHLRTKNEIHPDSLLLKLFYLRSPRPLPSIASELNGCFWTQKAEKIRREYKS